MLHGLLDFYSKPPPSVLTLFPRDFFFFLFPLQKIKPHTEVVLLQLNVYSILSWCFWEQQFSNSVISGIKFSMCICGVGVRDHVEKEEFIVPAQRRGETLNHIA